jgi:hypothetical protein
LENVNNTIKLWFKNDGHVKTVLDK